MSSSTSTNTPPVIAPEDIKIYYSGGYYNVDPNFSLGGETSSFQVISGTLNGLFDRVDTSEAELGDVEYRCIYLRNTNQTRKLLGTKIWIETGTASANTAIAISIGSAGINGTEPMITDEGIAPPMQFFEIPLQAPDEPNIGDLYPGDHIGLWVRWSVNTGTQSIADDFAVIRIDGEREPESITDPLPPPSEEPPPSGCPAGSKWSPTEERCVDDSTVIICPNGYTYNSTTQRCVPPSTPPPSIPNWVFAASGDFSCSNDADASGALIGSKLNKTAGSDVGLLLALGDFSYEDGDQSCWYDNMESNLGTAIYPDNVAPVLGNHEDSEDGSSSDRTSVIAEFPLMPTQAYYAFTRRNIRFIMMDTQSSYGTSSAQYTFVKSELEKATADPAIKWKIVCYHKPSFTTASYYAPLTDLRNAYHPLFDQHKVDLIFNGHNHIYSRSKPVKYNSASPGTPTIASDQATGNYINVDGRVFITSGAAGRSSHTDVEGSQESYIGFRHAPTPYGNTFVTLQDNGNQLRVQFITNANQILDDFILSKPGASPPPTVTCPTGFHYDDTLGRCVVSPTTCPTGYVWSPTQNKCVASSGNPPPPPVTSPGYPLTFVEWLYDATATLSTPQTIIPGNYDATQGIIIGSSFATPSANFTIANGYITIPGADDATADNIANTMIGVDYWKLSQFATDERIGKNTAYTFTFQYNNNVSVGVMDGNNYNVSALSPAKVFGGFKTTSIGPVPATAQGFTQGTSTRVEYYYNPSTVQWGQSDPVFSSFPSGRIIENGKDYKVFGVYRTDRINDRIIENQWLDFGDGNGWVKVVTDRIISINNWSPPSTPAGYDDSDEIDAGPTAIRRHRLVIRNNNTGGSIPRPSLKVKDIKVGTLAYVGEINEPPPPPPGGGGGGGSTGGTVDSRGIRWYMATGQQGTISQSRDESDDDRWSGNVQNVNQYGYEVTMIMQNFSGVASDGHFALKHWGPNHSGNCGYEESGDCCCWYDTGIRSNGNVQLEIERPHPSNHDFSLSFNATSGPLYMQNIGKSMNGNSIGLKWLVFPRTVGGTADNGGIRLMMWADINPIGSDGKPANNWKLVYDVVDTGQILGDYPSPSEHDIEVRNSGTNSRTAYGGGLHWRKIQAGDTLQWGTGGGGGTPPPSPDPPPTSGTLVRLISWGDNDTTQNAEDVLSRIFQEPNVSQYLFAGDGPYSSDATEWIQMMSSYFNTPTLKSKLMLAQGNHEHPESQSQQAEDQIETWFPGLNNPDDNLDWLQAKQVGNVYIIVMNSQDPAIATVGGDQYNWVQARLNDAVALRTAGSIKWIVTMVHKSWFNLLGSNPAYVTARNAYKTMFRNAQVDFMFHGHNHSYMIWKPIVSIDGNNDNTASTAVYTMSGSNYNFALDHGVIYVINGNGGHEINSWGEEAADFPNVSYANDTEYGYSVLDIDGSTATLYAKSVGGNIRHTITCVR